jgi:hypothetical protein
MGRVQSEATYNSGGCGKACGDRGFGNRGVFLWRCNLLRFWEAGLRGGWVREEAEEGGAVYEVRTRLFAFFFIKTFI